MTTPTSPPHRPDKCPSCRKPWAEHPGIAATCENLQRAVSTLKIIHSQAKRRTLDPQAVENLTGLTLGLCRGKKGRGGRV